MTDLKTPKKIDAPLLTFKKMSQRDQLYVKNSTKSSLRENELKNLFAYQQAVVIGILTQYCSVVIEKAGKDSPVTETAPKVVSVELDNELIPIRSYAENLTLTLTNQEERSKLKVKTVKRRTAKSASSYVNNYMIDLLREFGFFFNSTLSKKSAKTFQLERIHEIFYENHFIMGEFDLIECGKKINRHLNQLCSTKKRVFISKEDEVMHNFFVF